MARTVTKAGIRRRYAHLEIRSVDVPPGWLHLVEDCLAEVDRHTPTDERGAVRAGDIKEKHNWLSITIHAGSWVDPIVDLFEEMSDSTCAGCAAAIEAGSVHCPACEPQKRRKQ